MRFLRHRLAVICLVILILFALVAIFAKQIAPYGYDEIDLEHPDPVTGLALSPRLEGGHIFGTDQLGRDYLSRIIYGIRTSLWVAFFVAILATLLGTAVGAVSGYYGGKVDNLLMRFTDLILTLPGVAVLLAAAVYFGSNDSEVSLGPITVTIPQPMKIGIILALLFWVNLARVVRGLFLSLREKEFVEAAKAAGASDMRIIVRHILPNCVGPIVVTTTLFVALAILTETFLSFIGYGIQPPNAALGKLIVDGQSEGFTPGGSSCSRALPSSSSRCASTSSATACGTRSTRRSVGRASPVPEPILEVGDLDGRVLDRRRARPGGCRRELRPHPGEVLGIVGESGSGKSVSMLAVLGSSRAAGPDHAGEALYKGRDLVKMPGRSCVCCAAARSP